MQTTKTSSRFLSLALFALLLSAGAGCAATDGDSAPADENLGTSAAALTAPLVVATPATLDFGRTAIGTTRHLTVTLANKGTQSALGLTAVPPDPYLPGRAVPPDPYLVISHNPPTCLPAGQAAELTLAYTPVEAGAISTAITVTYHDEIGTAVTLRIPVRGSAE